MEKPDPAPVSPPPLTILHHDEHLVFPGYDLMVGNGGTGQDEERGKNPGTARDHGGEAEFPLEGQSSVDVVWYKKHKRKLIVAATICLLALAGLIAYISARPSLGPRAEASFEGIATFNDYSFQLETQGSTVCGGSESLQPLKPGVFGAAAGDLSPILSAGLCEGSQNTTTPSYNMDLCTLDGGRAPDANTYFGPPCPHARCKPSTCYKVENLGPVGSAKGEVLGSTTVQIIDGCPAGSAWNYCKTQYEPEARCSSPTTEALDLDFNAYSALYPGKSYSSGNPEGNANLQIRITPTSC
ncbi:MAG: hypothetical protein L6R38_005663 [Xanthoria sp. 2 TBL-2021]|nr:MAG: hypothetical protein L6R38_005663 [Xanthoria sp. 2 TBL-2021]